MMLRDLTSCRFIPAWEQFAGEPNEPDLPPALMTWGFVNCASCLEKARGYQVAEGPSAGR